MIVNRAPLIDSIPFDIEAIKHHVRADSDYFDAQLFRMAVAAASELEAYAQIALLDQHITVTLECGPPRTMFALPVSPVFNTQAVTVTLDGAAYTEFAVVTGNRPAIRFTSGRPRGLMVIEYVAGFADAVEDLPTDLIHAIYDQTAAHFEMIGLGDGKTTGMSPHMARIAARYRRVAL